MFRRDGHFADMVTAELAGVTEAPIYGMLAVDDVMAKHDWGKLTPPSVSLRGQPANYLVLRDADRRDGLAAATPAPRARARFALQEHGPCRSACRRGRPA
jgi:hypothetical protein